MPCNDWNTSPGCGRCDENRVEIKCLEAMLCGFTTLLEKKGALPTILNDIDWKETGLTKAYFLEWKRKHDLRDSYRKSQEEKRINDEKRRQELLNTLSEDDKRLLGIKG